MSEREPTEDAARPIAGRYWVEEVLGRGGMGAVYLVRDARDGKRLALKRGFSRDGRKAEKRKALLEREYHTLAQLAHPRIIEVYDYGVDELGPYYTMELLGGTDLDKGGRLPWREACALLCDVASSLAILHSRGLLHRDVSSRNVRCTEDGRAKLLDFGAMVCMGVAKDVVGTPPFVAPEALQMQALDARSDLFALGALGYYLLTGRHAYPARRLAELRDVWRSSPTPIQRFAPETPAALCHLVLALLSLDRSARPQSAAEVMERLCAVAGLSMDERIEVSRAYLATPTLVGREKALLAVRRRMLSLVRGDGGTLLISGSPGTGRSRLLDACVLEGKLLGATVLRADASDAAGGDWGVARALTSQIVALQPTEAYEAARLSRSVLSNVIDGLREGSTPPTTSTSGELPERSLILRELRDFLLAMSNGQRMLLVVDDVERIDEPSAALLAAIAHKAEKHSLMLVLSTDRLAAAAGGASLRLLRSVASIIELEHLDQEQTEALMRSVFGEVANLGITSGRIHALAHGNPRATMELAQHLVDRGLARYEAGSWSLPSTLDEADLPNTLATTLGARLSGLSRDARELCEILAVADGDPLTMADYASLTDHRDHVRVYRALDELVAARVLLADAERYRFKQRGFVSVLQEAFEPARRTQLHARLAECVAVRMGDVPRLAYHMLHGGQDRRAVELLCGLDLDVHHPPLPLLERALAASERLQMPRQMTHMLRYAVLNKAPLVMAGEAFRRQIGPVLDQLVRDSGLALYHELSHLPPPERLTTALTRTQERYAQTPEHERVYPIIDAIRELAKVSANFCSIAMQLLDYEFLESLPSIEPLLPLSPQLQVVAQIVEGARAGLRGQTRIATEIYENVLVRINEPDRAGFDAGYHRGVRLAIYYLLGLIEASIGLADKAEARAVTLDADREHRVNAWRVRVSLHLNQGNAEEARKCQRRAELLQLQEGSEQRYIGTSASFELIAHAIAADLIGVKRALDSVAEFAKHYAGWRPIQLLGQSHYRWLQGDLPGALECVMSGLDLVERRVHPYFCYLAAARIGLLSELGRSGEALSVGKRYVEHCRSEQLDSSDRWVHLAYAEALAHAGEFELALVVLNPLIEGAEATGMTGLPLGALYEARARIAIWMRDRTTFDRFAERCGDEYKKGKNPALSAKFARLLEQAREHHVSENPQRSREPADVGQTETGFETLQSRMLECVDENDRARCALTILLQSAGSFCGYLFGVRGQDLHLLAALPEHGAEEPIGLWLQQCLLSELESQASATATSEGEDEAGLVLNMTRYADIEGRTFEPIFLVSRTSEGTHRIAAVLAVQVPSGPRTVPSKELLAEIADQLLTHGDVTGVEI